MSRMMKILCAAVALCMVLTLGAAFADEASYNAGTYTAIGDGRNGPVIVTMTFSENAITDVVVDYQVETYHVGNIPMEVYPAQIVEYQTVNVDIVSGATISSVAMMDAVRTCVEMAGGDLSKLNAKVPTTQVAEDCEADVVVVGSGAAGMTAAIRAAEAGANVVLLEKLDILGGTSTFSIEAFGATEDRVHAALGNPVSSDAQYESLVKSNPAGNPDAFRILADENGPAVNWLYSIGAPLTVTNAGTFVATNREAGKMGVTITGALKAEVAKKGVDIRTGNAATELVMEDGKVAGVKVVNDAGEYTISAKAVVLATGGFGANNDMVAEYVPALKGYTNSCTVGAKGDGHKMAVAVGGQLGNMDAYETVRVNFTYAVDGPRVYYIGVLPNMGAIVVNKDGQRFINDQGGYGVGMKVVEQGGDAWAIFDQSMMDGVDEVRAYASLGLYDCAATLEELAEITGINAANLVETVETYKGYVANGKDEAFGRGMLNLTFDEAPFYACKLRAHVQGTFGGIVTNVATEVTDAEGAAIAGLYAAGECAFVGTKGANPMTVDVVFGGIAGTNAANFAK